MECGLHDIWNRFFEAETGTYEKSLWLDILLAEVLLQLKDDPEKAIEAICPSESSATLIACELLCGIHRTMSSASHDENRLLRDYALKGAGWRCIAVLEKFDLKDLSCHRQLGKILIWLFDEINKTSFFDTQTSTNPYLPVSQKKSTITNVLLFKPKSSDAEIKHAKSYRKKRKISAMLKSQQSISTKESQESKKRNVKKYPENGQSSESELADDMESTYNSFRLKSQFNTDRRVDSSSMNFDTSPVKTIQKVKLSASDYLTDRLKSVIISAVNQREFNSLTLSLLYKLCQVETETSESNVLPMNVQSVHFALKHLRGLQTECDPSNTIELKLLLLEILMSSLDRLFGCCDPFSNVVTNDVFQLLLQILEKVDKVDPPEFVFGISHTILFILLSHLSRNCSIDNLKKYYGEFFRAFARTQQSISNCIQSIATDSSICPKTKNAFLKKILDNFSLLISHMKKMRHEAIHIETCPQKYHHNCLAKSADSLHHHRNVLGEVAIFLNGDEAVCAVSFIYDILISLLDVFNSRDDLFGLLSVLRCALKCGACCCFSPKYLIKRIIAIAKLWRPNVSNLCFAVLEKTLYGELGGENGQSQCDRCKNCFPNGDPIEPHSRFYKVTWPFLSEYCNVYFENDVLLLNVMANHFLRVATTSNVFINHDILFCVLYPLFEKAKREYLLDKNDKHWHIITFSMRLFPYFLRDMAFVEEFTQRDGLKNIIELMPSSELLEYYCLTLEIIIRSELFKIKSDSNLNDDQSINVKLQSLFSLEMLLKSLECLTKRAFSHIKAVFDKDKINTLLDLSKYNSYSNFKFNDYFVSSDLITCQMPDIVKNSLKAEFAYPNDIFRCFELFLKSCCSLCTCCSLFRKYFSSQIVFHDIFIMLNVTLNYLYDECSMEIEKKTLTKILEYLITIGYSMADCTLNESKKLTDEIVSDVLTEHRVNKMESQDIKDFIDTLLRVAYIVVGDEQTLARDLKMKLSYLNLNSVENDDLHSDYEEDKNLMRQYVSEDSELYLTADEGYEADEESCQSKMSKVTGERVNFSLSISQSYTSRIPKDVLENSTDLDSLYQKLHEYKQYNPMMFPELCKTAVDLLLRAIKRLLTHDEVDDESKSLNTMIYSCFDRITSLLSIDTNYSSGTGLITQILSNSAMELYRVQSAHLKNLQQSVMNLVYILAIKNITAFELKLMLALFTHSNIPLQTLLQPLIKLCGNIQDNIPDFILRFPMQLTDDGEGEQRIMEMSNAREKSNKLSTSLQREHFKRGFNSCWTASGVSCRIDDTDFNVCSEGCAFSIWLQVQNHHMPFKNINEMSRAYGNVSSQKRTFTESYRGGEHSMEGRTIDDKFSSMLHLLSLVNENSAIEFWVDTKSGDLIIKTIHHKPNESQLLGEAKVENCFPLFKWNHLAVNIKECSQKRILAIQFSIFINESKENVVCIPVNTTFMKKSKSNILFLGHSLSTSNRKVSGCWYFSGLTLFRTPIFDQKLIMFFIANGPNRPPQSLCKIPNHPLNFSTLFKDSVSLADTNWAEILDSSFHNINNLQSNVLLSYFAHSPSSFQIYNKNSSTGTAVFKGKLKKSAFPQHFATHQRGSLFVSQHKGISPAVYLSGGPQLLLYLFARVVELSENSEEQAQALSILFKVSFSDARLYSMFYNDDILSLVQFVFGSAKCQISLHTIKVIMDVVCSCPILVNVNRQFHLLPKSNAIIEHPDILIALLQQWKQLECAKDANSLNRESVGEKFIDEKYNQNISFKMNNKVQKKDFVLKNYDLLESLFLSMEVLIRDNHPSRAFNICQLNRVNMVDQLLMFCKERFLNSEMGKLSNVTSCTLIELIRSLIGFPPQIHHIVQLMKFLIMMHKASETYVTHSRSTFYFLIWPAKLSSPKLDASNILGLKMPFSNKNKRIRKLHLRKQTSIIKFLSKIEKSSLKDNTEISLVNFDDEVSSQSSRKSSPNKNEKKPKGYVGLRHQRRHSEVQPKSIRLGKDKRRKRTRSAKCGSIKANRIRNLDNKTIYSRRGSNIMKEYVIIESDDMAHCSYLTTKMDKNQPSLKNLRSGSLHSWTICKGLLNLLKESVHIMPDALFRQVLGDILHSESLLILANHEDASVRTHVLHVIFVLIQRSNNADYKKIEESLFFHHLANQICQYPASFELIAACSSLITGCQTSLKEQLEDDLWSDINESSILRCLPLLSVLRCTLHDTTLLKNTVLLLKKVISKASVKILSEISISEGIIKCLQAIGISEGNANINEIILENLRMLLSHVAIKYISSPQTPKNLSDIYYQLSYLERENKTYSKDVKSNNVSRLMRDTQCYLISSELDFIENKIKEVNSRPSYTFANLDSVKSTLNAKQLSILQHQPKKSISSELQSRYSFLLSYAISFFLSRDVNLQLSTSEQKFLKRIFSKLIHLTLQERNEHQNKWWSGDNDWLLILNRLFKWIISPIFTSINIQTFILKSLRDFPHIKRLLTPSDLLSQRKIAVYLKTLVTKLAKENCMDEMLKEMVLDWISTLQLEQHIKSNALIEEANHLAVSDINEYIQFEINFGPADRTQLFKKENLARKIIDSAMSVTRTIVEIQNGQRKEFMNHLRQQQSKIADCVQKWHNLIGKFSHEKGPWYFQNLYPASWEIDSTEGPDRIRVRLKPCHLNIDKKFLKDKEKETNNPLPLSYLFESYNDNSQNSQLQKLHLDESITFMIRAVYVTVKSDQHGELLLSDRHLHFMPDSKNGKDPSVDIFWPLDSIIMMVTRRWQLRETAIELFLSSGHAELIAFETADHMESFLSVINKCYLSNRLNTESVADIINQWRNGEMTNWKYLMQLNGLAGRTYNDLMQYPVMPFILADYKSAKLNLKSAKSFRDLMKPMAIQNKENEKHYVDNYNDLKRSRLEDPFISRLNNEPFHYGSHYSNSGTVLHFLVRLSPFTNLFLSYQDSSFDIPDRTFHSLQTTWRLASCDSTTDVKELIPEFFYLPHFLRNSEGLDFGTRQCGEEVDNILLPPWAPNARLFILIHRQALESGYVKENIPNWIDLVFGYKQTGQAAIDAINVFHPATYCGFDVTSISDELERNAWKTMINLYGQTPRQLFKQPHPHCITDLTPVAESVIDVLPSVSGLRWGRYCGSPQEPTPVMTHQKQYPISAKRLLSLYNNEIIGLPANTTLLVSYLNKCKDIAVAQNNSTTIGHADLVTWGYPDGIIRIKQNKDTPLQPLFSIDSLDHLTVVAHGKENNSHTLWLGLQSGRVIVLSYIPGCQTLPFTRFAKKPTYLYGHDDAIVSIYVCDSFGVAATASKDGSVIVWDTHSLTYVRSIPTMSPNICDVHISETLCDVATVYVFDSTSKNPHQQRAKKEVDKGKSKCSSKIRVHTINAVPIGDIKIPERVTAICYSHAAEGVSVNSILVGLHSGAIRFYSSWDLKPLMCLTQSAVPHPIISIVYSQDSQHLYAAASDGTIMVWESATKSGSYPNFRMLTSYPVF